MILTNSMKNISRSRGKTVLFFFLIFSMTLILSLGIGLWDSVTKYLEECEKSYTTIALLEYMSPEYPDESVFDPKISEFIDKTDLSYITENENTIHWERSQRALGHIEGFRRFDSAIPKKQAGVLVVGGLSSSYYGGYRAHILNSLYSFNDMTSKSINIQASGYKFEKDKNYVIHGEFVFGRTAITGFDIFEYDGILGKDPGQITAVQELGEGELLPEEDSIFFKIADAYDVINNSVEVFATGDIRSMFPFHQQQLYVKEGRLFNGSEYASGDRVCIITEQMANKLEVGLGDILPVSIAVAEYIPIYETYWPDVGFKYEIDYEIIGITNKMDGMDHHVYVPQSADVDLSANQIGYTIGQAIIKNGSADDFYKDVEQHLPERSRLTIYDQGYSAVKEPFEGILKIVVIVSIVCTLLSLAILIFFGFIFVYRQRDVSRTMLLLGTGKARVTRYFLYGSTAISFTAAVSGILTAYLLSDAVVSLIRRIVSGFFTPHIYYSNSNLTSQKTLEFAPKADLGIFALTALSIVVFSILSCLVFTLLTFTEKRSGRKMPRIFNSRKIRKGHSSKMRGSAFKYSILSIRRGGARTLAIPLVAAAIMLFMGQLAHTANEYNERLAKVYEDSTITGQFTDPSGRQLGNLLIEGNYLNELAVSGYLESLSISCDFNYEYMDQSVVNGAKKDIPPFELPTGFAADTFLTKILSGPELVFTNDIHNTPEFVYADTIVMEFLDGYDENILSAPHDESSAPACIISSEMKKARGVELGDTIRILIYIEATKEYIELDLLVVGSFEKQGFKDNIYAQLDAYIPRDRLYGDPDDVRERLYWQKAQSTVFTVKDTSKIDEFRDFLYDTGFSEVRRIGQVRFFIVLEDRIFVNTVNTLREQIRYINILYPFLYFLSSVIGFLICYLLISIRRNEISVMYGLGTPKRRVNTTFFSELAFLSLLGCGIGIAIWNFAFKDILPVQFILSIIYLLMCFLGTVLALRKLSGKAAELE